MPGPGCIYGGLFFFVFFRLSHSDQFADRISHRGKLFFIFCHYISGTHDRIVVQIEGVGGNGPASFRDCFQLTAHLQRINRTDLIPYIRIQP